MSPTLRYIAFTIALLGLVFWGYKQQLHLPKPSLNPFDDQWEMRTNWLRENSTSYSINCGTSQVYEVAQESFRVAYVGYANTELFIQGKALLVTADTVKMIFKDGIEEIQNLEGSPIDSSYLTSFDFTHLDAVCAKFNYLPIGLKTHSEFDELVPFYSSESLDDTIFFSLLLEPFNSDTFQIRSFMSAKRRDLKDYPSGYFPDQDNL